VWTRCLGKQIDVGLLDADFGGLTFFEHDLELQEEPQPLDSVEMDARSSDGSFSLAVSHRKKGSSWTISVGPRVAIAAAFDPTASMLPIRALISMFRAM
jgi:hypothetical protein